MWQFPTKNSSAKDAKKNVPKIHLARTSSSIRWPCCLPGLSHLWKMFTVNWNFWIQTGLTFKQKSCLFYNCNTQKSLMLGLKIVVVRFKWQAFGVKPFQSSLHIVSRSLKNFIANFPSLDAPILAAMSQVWCCSNLAMLETFGESHLTEAMSTGPWKIVGDRPSPWSQHPATKLCDGRMIHYSKTSENQKPMKSLGLIIILPNCKTIAINYHVLNVLYNV